MSGAVELEAELRAGLEGVTPGPWRQCGGMTAAYRAVHSPSGYIVFGFADASKHIELGRPIQAPGWDEQDRNARHIARCSPENIATILNALATLRSDNERLGRERDEAIEAFNKFAEPRVKSFQMENGEFSMALTGPAVEHISAAMVGHFKALGAENYFEMNLYDRDEPFQRYVVTVQKVRAKSPHEFRAAAESERDTLLAQVEAMRGAIDGIYLYANDTLSGRADGGPDDRAWQRAAVVEIRNRARIFATVQSAVDARAALTKEPS